MLTALVAVVAILVIGLQNFQHRRDLRSAVALERARQDMLLTRLASRTPGEYVTAARAAGEIVAPEVVAPTAPPVRHLYDATGLIEVSAPLDIEDAAYDEAGAL